MGDPTFAYHFAVATQEDILRQAARHQQGGWERPPGDESRPGWRALLARRLRPGPWAHHHGAGPKPTGPEWLAD